jgi:hypothetical protein
MDSTIPATVPPTPGAPVPPAQRDAPLSLEAGQRARQAITGAGAAVIGTAFVFSFGNTTELGLAMGLPLWLALALAPAVDLTVLALIWGIRYASLSGIHGGRLWPARLLLVAAGMTTWALNTAAAWSARDLGRVALDSIAPALLITWAEVGPWFLRLFVEIREREVAAAVPPAVAAPVPPAPLVVSRSRPAGHSRRGPGRAGRSASDKIRTWVLAERAEGRSPSAAEAARRFGADPSLGRRIVRELAATNGHANSAGGAS